MPCVFLVARVKHMPGELVRTSAWVGVTRCRSAFPGALVPPRSDKLVSVCTQRLVPELLINKTSWLQEKLVFPRLHNYL